MRVNKYDQVPQLMTGKLITPASQVFTIPVVATKKTLDFSGLNNYGTINTVSSTGAAGRSITKHVNDIRKIQFYH